MGSLIIQTGPEVEPIDAGDLHDQLRIIGNQNDAYLTLAIKGARKVAEEFLDRALITQTWLLIRDTSPGKELLLPYPPLQSVTSINVYDWDDAATLVDSTNYLELPDTEPGRILLKDGATWPTHRDASSFKVLFVAGYGDAGSDVPEGIIHGIKMLCVKIFEHRGEEVEPNEEGMLQLFLNDTQLQNWLHPFKKVGM